MPLLVLSACAQTQCEPLREAVKRRSDAYGVYANEFVDYEPVAFAALPLHAPLPVLHIVSSAPFLAPPRVRRPPPRRPSFDHVPQPSYDHYHRAPPAPYSHASPTPYSQMLAAYGHQQPLIYAASIAYPSYGDPQPELPTTTEEAPTILYARPKPQGGYSYYRRPTKKRNVPKKQEPVIIRVHKYKILKGR